MRAGGEPSNHPWKDAEKYLGYRHFCEMMSKLWATVNGAIVNADSVADKIGFLEEEFLPWFKAWEESSRTRAIEALRVKFAGIKDKFSELEISHYFFTREGAMDLTGVAMGVSQLVKHVITAYPTLTLYLHRLSSDVVEHAYGSMRHSNGQQRMDGVKAKAAGTQLIKQRMSKLSAPSVWTKINRSLTQKRKMEKRNCEVGQDMLNDEAPKAHAAESRPVFSVDWRNRKKLRVAEAVVWKMAGVPRWNEAEGYFDMMDSNGDVIPLSTTAS